MKGNVLLYAKVGMTMLGTFLSIAAARNIYQSMKSRKWPTSKGMVSASKLVDAGAEGDVFPEVKYSYKEPMEKPDALAIWRVVVLWNPFSIKS